jgi:hypothetical protein
MNTMLWKIKKVKKFSSFLTLLTCNAMPLVAYSTKKCAAMVSVFLLFNRVSNVFCYFIFAFNYYYFAHETVAFFN